MRAYQFIIKIVNGYEHESISSLLNLLIFLEQKNQVIKLNDSFAFKFKFAEKKINGWDLYNAEKEYQRMGLDFDKPVRMIRIALLKNLN